MAGEKEKHGFIERFLSVAQQQPDLVAIQVEGEEFSLTYAGLLDEVECWRGYLMMMEVCKGEMVLILLPSGSEFIASFYAVVSIGGIAVPVTHDSTGYELDLILSDAKPVGIITSNAVLSSVHKSFDSAEELRFVLVTDSMESCAGESEGFKKVEIAALPRKRIPIGVIEDNPVICCQYTYKGFGYPLGVIHRYHDYTYGMECLEAMPQERGSVYLAILPIHYIYSFATLVVFPLSYGCKLVIVPEMQNQSVLALLEGYQVDICCLVPMLLQKLVLEAKAAREERSLLLRPNLLLVSGGSFLDSSLAQKVFESTGVEPLQGYGLTETLPVIGNCWGRHRRGSIGLPLSSKISVYIMDEGGLEVKVGQTGEIVIGGPTVTEGFYRRPKETARFLRNGLFHTGDLGFVDDDGFLYFVGRKCSITKVASKMTDLTEIENVLASHPDVIKARVSVRNSLSGEVVEASIIIERNSMVSKSDLKRFCRVRLSRHKIPSKFKIYTNIS